MLKKTRQELLAINPVLSNHLMILQDDKYNPEHYPVEEGDEVFLEEKGMTISLTQEEANDINKEDKAFYLSSKDNYKTDPSIQWVAGQKLAPKDKNVKEYLSTLTEIFSTLSTFYTDQNLLVLGDWPTPWLAEKGSSVNSIDAFKYFKSHCKATFNGGFVVEPKDINTFIPHLFWLTRGSDILPDFLMSFEKGTTMFSICKHAIVHMEFYDKKEYGAIVPLLQPMELKAVKTCSDLLEFS